MTNSASLERKYRQLLAWYPRAFRREHEQEILAVLMASAGGNGRGRGWARFAFVALFSINTVSLLAGLAGGAAQYATADAVAGGALWLVGLAALALPFDRESGPYFRQQPV